MYLINELGMTVKVSISQIFSCASALQSKFCFVLSIVSSRLGHSEVHSTKQEWRILQEAYEWPTAIMCFSKGTPRLLYFQPYARQMLFEGLVHGNSKLVYDHVNEGYV